MSTTLWFILILAFMYFMHRGHGSMGGGCGGGHSHGSHGRTSSGHHSHDGDKSNPDFSDIEEAEYEVLDEEPGK